MVTRYHNFTKSVTMLVLAGREQDATATAGLLIDSDAVPDLVRTMRMIPPPLGTIH